MLHGDVILYHGTHHIYAKCIQEYGIRVDVSSRSLDFGPGFYMTTSRSQAIEWAQRIATSQFIPTPRRAPHLLEGIGISPVELDTAVKRPALISVHTNWDDLRERFRYMIFTDSDATWQSFVFLNRIGLEIAALPGARLRDWNYGPVADGGLSGPAEYIVAYNGYDQISFHTESVARFIMEGGIHVEEIP